jgi:alkanesulfonate monooxygenase SsuD/methylene tetrahydromethanopterin reductase-like flavin-dependent oxidoreductase (luciferase family)
VHLGITMECDYRDSSTQEEAFSEAFEQMQLAEDLGLDGIWLAERHFAAPKNPQDPGGTGIPSVVSVPLIVASAMAARTQRIRIGLAVAVLPLCHPIRMAEEAATVDQISQGRLDFGVGRSGFARSYEGYGIPYGESRERFDESLEVILKAWTNERFSHEGQFYSFDNVCVLPKPYQQPHPPFRVAATTRETFPHVGRRGFPVFVGLRGMDVPELSQSLESYRDAWKEAGHPGNGDVLLRMPLYVAETEEKAQSEPEVSTMSAYGRLARNYANSSTVAGMTQTSERAERGERLAAVTYEDVLRDRVAYGNAETVAERLMELTEELHLSGIIAEINVGGLNTKDRVLNSLRLFGEKVAPMCR